MYVYNTIFLSLSQVDFFRFYKLQELALNLNFD